MLGKHMQFLTAYNRSPWRSRGESLHDRAEPGLWECFASTNTNRESTHPAEWWPDGDKNVRVCMFEGHKLSCSCHECLFEKVTRFEKNSNGRRRRCYCRLLMCWVMCLCAWMSACMLVYMCFYYWLIADRECVCLSGVDVRCSTGGQQGEGMKRSAE